METDLKEYQKWKHHHLVEEIGGTQEGLGQPLPDKIRSSLLRAYRMKHESSFRMLKGLKSCKTCRGS